MSRRNHSNHEETVAEALLATVFLVTSIVSIVLLLL